MSAIRLPDDIDRRLADLARKTGRTKADCAREAILMYIEDIHVAEGQLATSVPMIILFDNPAQPFPQTNGGNPSVAQGVGPYARSLRKIRGFPAEAGCGSNSLPVRISHTR